MSTSLQALNAVNFFMADVVGGLGPYLGVFLQQKDLSPAQIGAVMTIGGLAGMVATAPLGALVDRVQRSASSSRRAFRFRSGAVDRLKQLMFVVGQ